MLCFSALQRAENSSIGFFCEELVFEIKFQCSSASRKFLNTSRSSRPSSARKVSVLFSEPKIPQCESLARLARRPQRFSALQRAENSSMAYKLDPSLLKTGVSVLFSEPKIPQSSTRPSAPSSMLWFQCSSASRKFLNIALLPYSPTLPTRRFSALQRAENSSIQARTYATSNDGGFSALQRAENSSMMGESCRKPQTEKFQCSSASRKFLNPTSTATPTLSR